MRKLNVSIEISGVQENVGTIAQDHPADAVFQYADSYLCGRNHRPISLNLPFQKEPFSPEKTRSFFEGLLPEGFMRRSLAQSLKADESDYLSILEALGKECIGALKISQEETIPAYIPVTEEEIRKLAEEGTSVSAEMILKSHLSLTGASGKVGLYRDKTSGNWFLPVGEAPSTHIVKQSHIRLRNIVANEQMSLLTAKKLGIEVPKSFIINTGAGRDEDVLLATERFDRIIPSDGRQISGYPAPCRLHQEDFAQALGIPGTEKYETDPSQQYMKKMFSLLEENSADPLSDELQLWDRIVFNDLIGNTDGHIKNLSLLYSADLSTVRLAPAYDIVCTAMYQSSTEEMAFSIGGDRSLHSVSRDSFVRASRDTGLAASICMAHYDRLRSDFQKALNSACDQMKDQGYKEAEKIRDAILHAGGTAYQSEF